MTYTYDISSEPMAYLDLHGPQDECRHLTVESGTSLSIGSHESCDLQLVGSDISAMHCVLKFLNGILWIQDWNTRTGTLVDGNKVVGETELSHGTTVQLGAYQFTIGLTPPDAPPHSTVEPLTTPLLPPSLLSPIVRNDEPDHNPSIDSSIAVESIADEPIGYAAQAAPWDALSDETLPLLQEEIHSLQHQLQAQIAETDRLRGQRADAQPDSQTAATPVNASFKPERALELMEELERSDERIATLEELLLITEEANLAEQEERRQIEAWIDEVEVRFGQREAEVTAENEVLKRKLNETLAERNQLELRLQNAASPERSREMLHETLDQLRTQNSALIAQLEQRQQHETDLERNIERLKEQTDPDALQRRLDEAVREERLQMAQERAELARQRVAMVRELEHAPQAHRHTATDSETKFQALRQHLKDIHVQELQEKKERSIGSRLAKLWKNLE